RIAAIPEVVKACYHCEGAHSLLSVNSATEAISLLELLRFDRNDGIKANLFSRLLLFLWRIRRSELLDVLLYAF
ncbi:MAG: hypothetical protein ABH844_03220, partial [Candidatus Omnitrophota bacterium]